MHSISTRGLAALVNLSRVSNSSTLILRQCAPRKISRTPALVYAANFHTTPRFRNIAATAEAMEESLDQENGLFTQFGELAEHGLVYKPVIETVQKSMGLTTMTPVQSQTIKEAIQGIDTLALARTGTGKTVAFLLPVIQRILTVRPELEHRQRRGVIDIRALIISPTRELAEQIAKEARRMVGATGIQVGLAVGGTGRNAALREMNQYGCNILVGTPGRLNDLLSDPHSGVKLSNVTSFVLDEADRLLDDGFGPAVQEIAKYLPSKTEVDRQTLMFSATMDPAVMGMVRGFMKRDYRTVRTIAEGEIQTHEKVPQYVVATKGLENQIPALFQLVKRESMANENFKAIVFFNTAAETKLTRAAFGNSILSRKLGIHAFEMHARLTQANRTSTSNKFRSSNRAIMFSSDVAARGMDFPNVTHVIQFGLPNDRDSYIHRVGRTGRAGKEGQGWVLLSPWEKYTYQKRLGNLPIKVDTSLEAADIDMTQQSAIPQGLADILTDAVQATRDVDTETKFNAFKSNLSSGQSMDKTQLINALNQKAKYGWGMDVPPSVPRSLASKLGYGRIPQLRISDERYDRTGDMGERSDRGSYSRSRFSPDSNSRSSGTRYSAGRAGRDGYGGRGQNSRFDRGSRESRDGDSQYSRRSAFAPREVKY